MNERYTDRETGDSRWQILTAVMAAMLLLMIGVIVFVLLNAGRPPVVGAADATPSSSPTGPVQATGSPMVSPMPTATVVPTQVASTPIASPTAVITATPTPTAVPTATPATTPATPAPSSTPRPPVAGDSRDAPIVVDAFPYTYQANTRRANDEPSDPGCNYGDNATIWFSYTPQSSMLLGASTEGSEYDTMLGAFETNGSGDLTLIDCNDDAVGVASRLRFHAEAAHTYVFMVGALSRRGGSTVFSLGEATEPGSIDLTINPAGSYNAAGRATISGTVSCRGISGNINLSIELRQVVDRDIVTGDGYLDLERCPRRGIEWSVEVESYRLTFGSEPAIATGYASGSDGWAWLSDRVSADIVLTPIQSGPPPTPSPTASLVSVQE